MLTAHLPYIFKTRVIHGYWRNLTDVYLKNIFWKEKRKFSIYSCTMFACLEHLRRNSIQQPVIKLLKISLTIPLKNYMAYKLQELK